MPHPHEGDLGTLLYRTSAEGLLHGTIFTARRALSQGWKIAHPRTCQAGLILPSPEKATTRSPQHTSENQPHDRGFTRGMPACPNSIQGSTGQMSLQVLDPFHLL